MKKYKAKTDIHISVVLKSGKSAHITFASQTGGGSVYYTDNKEIQEAIKKHPKFGKLFKEVAVEEPKPKVEKNDAKKKSKASKKAELKKVSVTDLDSAKDYLSEKFDVSRTKLKSEKEIKAEAKKHGIEFEGI